MFDSAHCHELSHPNIPVFIISLLTLFTIYFPRATPLLPAPDLHHPNKASPPSYNVAITVTLVFVVELVFTIFYGSGIWISGRQGLLDSFAFVNGIFAAILSLLQYFPQIWTTFELKHVGSLSIPMMCIQIPGSLLWAASYVVRLGWSAFDAWGVLALTALFQACLLAMAVIFELRDRRQRKKGMDGMNGIEDEASEETPLLHD
ncbi:MAG: hypothetical protein M1834_003647 [Cirrosporium novae-zelandiae]|nr:MAG: hypothetical protein M1834_003647 [Cirrosporium novae-zelandiae]